MSEPAAVAAPATPSAPAATSAAPAASPPSPPPAGAAAAEGTTAAAAPAPKPPSVPSIASRILEADRRAREASATAKAAEERALAAEATVARFEAFKKGGWRKDPDAFLGEFEAPYQDLTKHYATMGDEPPPWQAPLEAARAEVDALKAAAAERKAAEETAAAERAFASHVDHARKVASEAAGKYKLVSRKGDEAFATAVEAVSIAWKADGSPTLDVNGYNEYLGRAFEQLEGHYAAELARLSDPPAAPIVAPADATAAALLPARMERPAPTITSAMAGSPGTRAQPKSMSVREVAALWADEQPPQAN